MSSPFPQDKPARDSKESSSSDLSKPRIDEVASTKSDLVDEDPTPFRWTDVFLGRKRPAFDLDATATRRSVYDDPALAKHYWPNSNYENLHRFDPEARWSYREEKVSNSIVMFSMVPYSRIPETRQENRLEGHAVGYVQHDLPLRCLLTRRVFPAAISFSALNLDRGNLTQANTDNFLPDLKMTTNGMWVFENNESVTHTGLRLQLGEQRVPSGLPKR